MNRLCERILVDCPVADTESRIESYFTTLRGANGVARLRLRVPVVLDGLALSIDREVCIEAKRMRDDENLNDIIRVLWKPEGSVVFPVFEGRLVIWGEDDPARSFVELNGGYTAPFGTTGKAFDAVIGHKIARRTALQFLSDIKMTVEKPDR
jgi:hypothetical protein